MKINKSDIKDAIISALNEQEEEASLAATDKTKFQRKSMAASTFAKAGKEQRKEANGMDDEVPCQLPRWQQWSEFQD